MDIGSLVQSYVNAVTKPNPGTFAEEIPRANNNKTLIGVAAVAVVSAITSLLSVGGGAAYMDTFREQFRGRELPFDPDALTAGGGIGAAIGAFIFTFIFFYVGSGILYLTARMLGGQGSDYLTHSYLLSLSYVPLGIASAVLGIVPVLGLLGIVLLVYRQYLQGLSMQASQNLTAGRAQLAAFLPIVLAFVLACLLVVLCVGMFAAAIGGGDR